MPSPTSPTSNYRFFTPGEMAPGTMANIDVSLDAPNSVASCVAALPYLITVAQANAGAASKDVQCEMQGIELTNLLFSVAPDGSLTLFAVLIPVVLEREPATPSSSDPLNPAGHPWCRDVPSWPANEKPASDAQVGFCLLKENSQPSGSKEIWTVVPDSAQYPAEGDSCWMLPIYLARQTATGTHLSPCGLN